MIQKDTKNEYMWYKKYY